MMPMMKNKTVQDAMAVRERKISSGIFFWKDVANELTFLLNRKLKKNETGQILAVYIPDPFISTDFFKPLC